MQIFYKPALVDFAKKNKKIASAIVKMEISD